ncbi:hypothetical protein BDB00DRAFT_807244 [Zychaea mexicana]|uniref:uncharacterized protein n=1 Tax=Zychaea mexicana TaxID=64656 RepID=UPI0022FEE42A|nr:uncharacterized protein BDB00DRAFT_807244 [Zychaea mexicana]KAI9496809.1 hypothetical protein BDB00DRAFT_807244 [Zychaea mexicana]
MPESSQAESSKAASSTAKSTRSRGAGRDTDRFLEQMLYGPGVGMMDLDDLEEAFKDHEGKGKGVGGVDDDNEDDNVYIPEEDEEEEDWAENVEEDTEITQLLDSTKTKRTELKTGGLDEIARDFEEFEDNLITTTGIGKTRHGNKRRITSGEARLPPEVKEMLGQANQLYISQDFGKAIDFLQNLITKHPNVYQAWNTLGLVHEEMGHRDKSLQLRMVAAHMNQNDAILWKELGVKSIEAGATQQAIYCFSKALVVDPTDVDALWDRSFLYRKTDHVEEAIDGFEQILKITPHHFKVINELVPLYRNKGMIKESIELYENAVKYHMEHDTDEEERQRQQEQEDDDDFNDRLGYTEVNMLSELYLMHNDYRRALETIKSGIRYVQHRQYETYWDAYGDNDEEYFEDSEHEERSDFPIELRVRMGVCRVYLGDVRTAGRHFQYLLKYPATTYPDLHQDIAYAYMDKRHYDPALSVFQKIIDVSEEVDVDLLIRTADCYHQVGELETAALFYANVLEEHPDNLDVMLSLASVYEEQQKEEAALELVDYVMQRNRDTRRKKKQEEQARKAEEEKEAAKTDTKKGGSKKGKASIFDEANKPISRFERYKRRRIEFARQEEERNRNALALFAKVAELDKSIPPNVVDTEKAVMREYIHVAQELYREFSQTTAFYPSDRSRRFTGFFNRKNKTDKRSLDREAHQMARRLRTLVDKPAHQNEDGESDEEEERIKDEEERDEQLRAASMYRGASFDVWCDLFIKFGYMLAVTRQAEASYDMLKRVSEANVFYHDSNKIKSLKLALLGCALINDNDAIRYETQRWFITNNRFQPSPYHLMFATLTSGLNGLQQYANPVHMKHVMRTVRLIDTVKIEESKAAAANAKDSDATIQQQIDEAADAMEVDPSTINFGELFAIPNEQDINTIRSLRSHKVHIPDEPSPIILYMFGMQLTVGRSFSGACLLMMRANALESNDPITLLSLAVNIFNRAMSRKTSNRHFQILQGFYFLDKYRRLRGKCQETEFNFGRAFHLLGLTHLAVPHYERVLVMPPSSKQGKVPEKSLDSIYEFDDDAEEDSMEVDVDEDDEGSDLRREAAYNLQLIYVTSGSPHLARLLLAKYCWV